MHMKTEYVVMLEPDNWIHREIRVHPKHDAGGLFDANPPFSNELIHWAEKQGTDAPVSMFVDAYACARFLFFRPRCPLLQTTTLTKRVLT